MSGWIRSTACKRQEIGVVELGEQSFAGRDRDVDVVRHFLQRVEVLGRHRFLEIERPELLHPVADADGVGGRQAAVHLDQQLDIVAHRFAHRFQLLDGQVLGCPVAEDAPVLEGIALQCSQAPFDVVHGVFDGCLRCRTVPPAVRPDSIPYLAAEQFVHRGAQCLALDVPEGDFDSADGGHLHDTATDVKVVVERLPVLFDLPGILPDQFPPEFVHHRGDGEGAGSGFAPTGDPFVGLDPDEDEVAGNGGRKDLGGGERLDGRDVHGGQAGIRSVDLDLKSSTALAVSSCHFSGSSLPARARAR